MSDKEYYEFNTNKEKIIVPTNQLQKILDLGIVVRWNHRGQIGIIPTEIIINELYTAGINNRPRVIILWQQTTPF